MDICYHAPQGEHFYIYYGGVFLLTHGTLQVILYGLTDAGCGRTTR